MTEEPITGAADQSNRPEHLRLDEEERRVLGVLIEKGLTTPQSYPMSLSALVSGCNQRSNRDPVTHYDEAQVQDVVERLQQRDLATHFYPGEGGRVDRWRQDAGKNLELRGVQLAVLGELLLRGPQSMGELRQRASRMREVANLAELSEILDSLVAHSPPLVVRLTPEGTSRGVRYTHACYPQAEMEQILEAERSGAHAAAPATRAPRRSSEVEELTQRIQQLEERVARLEAGKVTN